MTYSSHVKLMRQRVAERILAVGDRVRVFEEIKSPYTEQEAALEASRCVYCLDAPCTQACPVHIDIRRFVKRLSLKDPKGAKNIIRESCYLPGICGRVCPVDLLCEGACAWVKQDQSIAIGSLQRFAADYERREMVAKVKPNRGKKAGRVAVIGSGPAGLAVAAELTKMGHEVTIHEAESEFGGLLTNGISPMKLPVDVAKYETEYLVKLGIKTKTGTTIQSLGSLFEQGYDAAFVGVGLPQPKRLGILGEDLKGVYLALNLIKKVRSSLREFKELPQEFRGSNVAVVGAGDVGVEAASMAVRLGVDKVVVYEMLPEIPAYSSDVNKAKDEGIDFQVGLSPLRILGKESVEGLELIRMKWEQDAAGKPVPIAIEGSQFRVDANIVIVAIGQTLDTELAKKWKLNLTKNGILVDEHFQTSYPGVFAAGDVACKGARATVVQTLADARQAAKSINEYIMQKHIGGK